MDVLFNNAGIARGGQFATLTADDLEAIDRRQLPRRGLWRAGGLRAASPPRRGSCLLNTCSASGIYGSPGLSLYSATKFGVRGLTEALELEWAPHGIKVRSLMPGFIDTAILDLVPPHSNRTAREAVREAGLEFTPVEQVARAAWDAVHGRATHTLVGPTAHRLARAAKWFPTLHSNGRWAWACWPVVRTRPPGDGHRAAVAAGRTWRWPVAGGCWCGTFR